MHRRSLRFRLTVWYAVVLAAGLSLFSGLIWLSLRHRLMQEIDQDLEGRATRFEQYFAKRIGGGRGRSASRRTGGILPGAAAFELCRSARRERFHVSLSGERTERRDHGSKLGAPVHLPSGGVRPGDLRSHYGGRTHPRICFAFCSGAPSRWSSRLLASGEHG